jgi:small subunit ribosomal protein S16
MATVIRLQRGGRKKRPFYSVVVMDSRNRRDGAFIEKLGYYDPCKHPEVIEIDRERAKHWISQGAEASGRVVSLLKAAAQGPARIEKAEQEIAAKKVAEDVKKKAAADAAAIAKKAEEAATAKAAEEAAAAEAKAAEEAASEAEAPAEGAADKEAEEKTDA